MVRTPLSEKKVHTGPLKPGYGAERLAAASGYYRSMNRPMGIAGSLLVMGALLAQLLPPSIRSSNIFNGILSVCLATYAFIGFLFLRNKFQISFPIFALGLIQLWMVVTVFLGPSVFGLEMKLGRNLWWPAFVIMPYFAAFVMIGLNPRWRQRLLNFILVVSIVSATFGLLQFVKFPGVAALSNHWVSSEGLKEYGLEKRASGFSTHPFHLSAQCILGMGIIASNLLFRKFKNSEIFYYALLSAGLVVAQARTFYIAWALLTIVTLVFLFWRSKPQFFAISSLMAFVIVSLVVVFPDQLSYGLSGKNTIADGRQNQWSRADELSEMYPLTGIGPKETVFGSGTDLAGSRWYSIYTESGYRMSRVSGGVIGLVLMILLVSSCAFLSIKVWRDPKADPIRRQAAFAGSYYIAALGLGLYITNIVENEQMTYYGFVLAAIVAPQVGESLNKYQRKAKMLRDRVAANQQLAMQASNES